MTGEGPRVTVVVPAWNSKRWLAGCLDGLSRQTFAPFRTLVVDDGSTDGATESVGRTHPWADVLHLPRRRGFARAANAGIRSSAGEFVALLNADTRPEAGWLAALVESLDRSPPEVGSAASRMLRMDRPELVDDAGDELSWYGSARKRGHLRPAAEFDEPAEVLSPCAGAALYRRRLFDTVGLFDPTYDSYFEDVDLGLRARLFGYRCVYVPGARVLHQGHGSRLPRGRYVRLVTRNRIATLLKNLPARLLVRHTGKLLWGQVYFLVASRRPLHSLLGTLQAVARLPRVLRARRRVRSGARLDRKAIEGLLETELAEPPLRSLLRRRRSAP